MAATALKRGPKPLPPIDPAAVAAAAREHVREHGRRPSAETKGKIPALGITWGSLNQYLARGWRGFPPGSCLPAFLDAHGVGEPLRSGRNPNPPIGLDRVREAIARHVVETGEVPTASGGRIPGMAITWRTLDVYLAAGRGGLPGGSTLSKLAREVVADTFRKAVA